jgi:hypothetical protein
VTNCLE